MSDLASGNGHRDALPPRGTGRRRSMIILGVLLLALPFAFLVRELTDTGWRPVVTVDVLETEGVIYVPDAEVYLVDGEPPIALDAHSPHLGELISYCTASETFVSLAHGELFDREGRYLEGPAERGMSRVGVRVQGGVVEINLLEKHPGPPRTERGETPTGRLCTPQDASLVGPGSTR